MRMQRKFLGVQQVSGKKKTALLKGKGGGGGVAIVPFWYGPIKLL